MRLVLDTNVLISAFLWGGKPKILLDRVFNGIDEICFSLSILAEVQDVLSRPKFGIDPKIVHLFIQEIQDLGSLVFPHKLTETIVRDPKDHIILECAQAANADYIITGDNDLLTLDPWQKLRILRVADYLETHD